MKYIIKSCPHLMTSFYADGREVTNECGDSVIDMKCCDRNNCLLKKIVDNLLNVVKNDLCSRCDGIGHANGCKDDSCGTYVANECLGLLEIEFIEE